MITSRSQAADLLWSFDALLRRLNDAAAGGRRASCSRQQPMWSGPSVVAFDPVSAARSRGGRTFTDPGRKPTQSQTSEAVLLLDEIDKADPDVPNDLLEPFGTRSFTVRARLASTSTRSERSCSFSDFTTVSASCHLPSCAAA